MTCLLLVLAWLAAAPPTRVIAQDNPPVAWAWSGAVTHDAARVVARVATGVTQVRLVLTPDRANAESTTYPATGWARPSDHSVTAFTLKGLESSTRYRYRVETPGGGRLDGRFRTYHDGPFSFRLAFASCASTASNHRIFDTIRQLHAAGTTILLVEQNARMALQVADRGYVIQTGEVILSDRADNLRENQSVQKAYLGVA